MIISPLYILANFLDGFNLFGLYGSIATCLVMLIIYGIHLKMKKPIKEILMLVYALLSQSVSIYLKILSGTIWWVVFVEFVFGLLFMFACLKIFESIVVIGFTKRLTITDSICGGILVVAVFLGLCNLNIYSFSVFKIFAIFTILISTIILPLAESLTISSLIAISSLLYNNNPYLMATIILTTVICNCFRGSHRIFICLSAIVVEVMSAYYFDLYYIYNYLSALPTLIACLAIICVPKKEYDLLISKYNASFASRSLEQIINRNRNNIHSRLMKLSQVFSEMDKVFRSMIKG